MVQVMETWFLSDRAMLRRYFGDAFRENLLRAWPDLESVPKATVLATLDQATVACRTRYAKGRFPSICSPKSILVSWRMPVREPSSSWITFATSE